MDIVYNLLIPIISSLFGSMFGGLFTLLGVKITLSHEKKTHLEDLQRIKKEQRRQELERNIEINKFVLFNRPELTLTDNSESIKNTCECYLLPYKNVKLVDNNIEFRYSNKIFEAKYWEKFQVILQNTGERTIIASFLHISKGGRANIYTDTEMEIEQQKCKSSKTGKFYFKDEVLMSYTIKPNDKIMIIIHYPKNDFDTQHTPLDIYMRDEDMNYWVKNYFNHDFGINSNIVLPEIFNMHLLKGFNYRYTYEYFYYKEESRDFKNDNLSFFNKIEANQEKFVQDIKNGLVCLNSNLPFK